LSYGAPDFTQKADVNIIGQTVTVEIKIVGSSINVPIDIAAQSLGNLKIDIAAASIGTLNVDIVGQTVGNIKVDIAAQSVGDIGIQINAVASGLNIPVDIVAQSIGSLKIDIASQSIGNVNINLADVSFAGNLNVNIASQDIILNINVTNEVLKTGGTKSCLIFDGVNSYVEAPNFVTQKPFSLIIWVKLNMIKKSNIFESRDKAFASGGKGLTIEDGDIDGFFQVGIGDGTTAVWSDDVIDLRDKDKHCIMLICTSSTLYIYLDNVLLDTVDVSGLADSPLNAASTLKLCDGLAGKAVINIYELLYYEKAISDEERSHIFNNPFNPPTNYLKVFYLFDEGSGNILHDKTPNGYDATIYNCIWGSEEGSVSASLNINIKAQTVGISIQAEWQAQIGNLKNLYGSIEPLSAGTGGYVINYSVPSGKTLYIYNIAVAEIPTGTGAPLVNVNFNLNIAGNSIARAMCSPESPTQNLNFTCPLKVEGGTTIYIYAFNSDSANDIYVNATITGYEV